jgi:hypothetical protein
MVSARPPLEGDTVPRVRPPTHPPSEYPSACLRPVCPVCPAAQPDDDQYWWGQLQGETYRLMVANAEHSFATGACAVVCVAVTAGKLI